MTGVYGVGFLDFGKLEMENENQPLVSIGVPVFNGGKGIDAFCRRGNACNYGADLVIGEFS